MFVLYLNANYKVFVAQSVKNLPAVQETGVQSLGWEDALEKEMATHSSILAWKISWTEEPGGMQSMGSQRVGHDWAANTNTNKGVRNFEKISLKEMCSFALSPSCCLEFRCDSQNASSHFAQMGDGVGARQRLDPLSGIELPYQPRFAPCWAILLVFCFFF